MTSASTAGEAEAVKQAEKVAARVAAAAAAGRGCSLLATAHQACCPRSEMSPWLAAGCISSRRLLSIVMSRLRDTEGDVHAWPCGVPMAPLKFDIEAE